MTDRWRFEVAKAITQLTQELHALTPGLSCDFDLDVIRQPLAKDDPGEPGDPTKTKALCRGCRDDYYNSHGPGGCWLFDDARLVECSQVGTWDEPPYKWAPESVLSCHRPPGRHWLEYDDCRFAHNWKADRETE
jgi:hypothetical protein